MSLVLVGLVSAVFRFVPVTVDAAVEPASARTHITVDDKTQKFPFVDHIRRLSVTISDGDDGHKPTVFELTPLDMLWAGFNVHADWRLVYALTLTCDECKKPVSLTLGLKNGKFDREARTKLQSAGIGIEGEHIARVDFKDPENQDTQNLLLPAGTYELNVVSPCARKLDDKLVEHDDGMTLLNPCDP